MTEGPERYLNTREVADTLTIAGFKMTATDDIAVVWLNYSEGIAIHADGRIVAEAYDRTNGLEAEIDLGRTSSILAAVTTVKSYCQDRTETAAR